MPAGKSCFKVSNFLGPELTVSLTNRETGQSQDFRVAAGNGTSETRCVDPGRYSVTIDAPPPWSTLNGDVTAAPGELVDIPVYASR